MSNKEDHRKTVVFAPLNWGLGHASRLYSLIHKYNNEGWRIILASDGNALQFLQKEFPEYTILDIKSRKLRYSKYPFLLAHLWCLLPAFVKNIRTDRQFVSQLAQSEKIDLIISDNRYGFNHPKIKCVILSHQLQLAIPPYLKWGRSFVQNKLSQWLNAFNECWIVDDDKHSLAGQLSNEQSLKVPFQFIGLQSRFDTRELIQDIDFLVVLSGLEPHRTQLEQLLIKAFKGISKKVVIVGGHFNKQKPLGDIEYRSFANTIELNELLNRSHCVISRSGYSSIMDLIKLNKKAILIPTPGQVEQEYLAKLHTHSPNFSIAENSLASISLAITNSYV